MKRVLKTICTITGVLLIALLSSCTNSNWVMDNNTPITDHNWSYVNRIRFDCKIDDESAAYNLYLNLRVTDNYKYSNLFVLIYETPPDKKVSVTRYEVKLAGRDGEWFGKGSGNLYSYQVPFKTNIKFPVKGNYHFEIEQNMRDNPLHEISDVGLRVEKAK
ncbi:gliding motility lipoprotein GldH [Mucilaginibacter lappiensis]|uniref:Gliding motility-associated lipoprotein GldH n=1 Tax=Mucilaginibacter lappiensis TaxID=354630 RepID=A0A841JL34_9SPHI|nr:gliding motility lipoprotein GldH [Mucilaginibacter lappiensis]MBB6129438.1 gliding motility-associated lipoprotein GldH [Mucilaginibacter lappiensis]